jgi:hypothetical protein
MVTGAIALGAGCAANPGTSALGGTDAGPPGTCPAVPSNDDLIADFTMDNGIHPTADGRSGGFYVYGDTLGMFDPPKMGDNPYPIDMNKGNPYCSGPGSFHVKAIGFADWGAAAGTDFVPAVMPMVKGSYDASQYVGISFWASASAEVQYVQVKFPDIYTDPQVPNPVCVLTPGAATNCSPYIVKLDDGAFPKYAGVTIGQKWKQYKIYFADTQQDQYNAGYHRDPPNDKLDVQHLLGFAIQVNANYMTMPQTANNFEMWIDDVEFMRP